MNEGVDKIHYQWLPGHQDELMVSLKAREIYEKFQ